MSFCKGTLFNGQENVLWTMGFCEVFALCQKVCSQWLSQVLVQVCLETHPPPLRVPCLHLWWNRKSNYLAPHCPCAVYQVKIKFNDQRILYCPFAAPLFTMTTTIELAGTRRGWVDHYLYQLWPPDWRWEIDLTEFSVILTFGTWHCDVPAWLEETGWG